jgi:hypothetical protein
MAKQAHFSQFSQKRLCRGAHDGIYSSHLQDGAFSTSAEMYLLGALTENDPLHGINIQLNEFE